MAALGHEVLALQPKAGILDIAAELASRGFQPDLLVQTESLGPRTILQGLPLLGCVKLFWSIDTHLNLFWHRDYGRLFDAVLTTQPHLVTALAAEGFQAHWLPWFGLPRPWRPWARRDLPVHFIGRVTEHRPARKWMVEHLSARFGMGHDGNLPYGHMLDTYDRVRIAPNEAISGEINFRLFEAASCGCAVVTPDTGPGLGELFRPGEEIATFTDVLEIDERIACLLRNPARAEAMARAGWERVQACHLAEHRALRILELARNLSPRAPDHGQANIAMALTLHALARDNRLELSADVRNSMLARVEQTDRVLQARLLLAAEGLGQAAVRALAGVVLARSENMDPALLATGSMAAARVDDLELALAFWRRRLLDLGPVASARLPRPADIAGLAKAWAGELARIGRISESGFCFDLDRHVPTTAHECLLLALRHDNRDLDANSALEALLARERGTEASRLSLLSHLSLHKPGDWRLGLRLGLLNLKAFRPEAGIEELRLALRTARDQGQMERCLRALAGMDASGRAIKALLAAEAPADSASQA